MPWVRIDEEFPNHPKVSRVGPFGVAVQVAALCYSNRYLTDGFIPYGAVRTLLDFNRLGENIGDRVDVWVELGAMVIAQRLVEAGMWEEVDGGFLIHDFHIYQPSRAQVEAERKKTKERVAKYRENKRKGGNTSRSTSRNKSRNAVGNAVTNVASTPAPVPVPVPPVSTTGSSVTDTPVGTTGVEQARPIDDVIRVFQVWQDSTGKHRAKLDGNRRYAIKAALDRYDAEDVLAAVQGWVNDPWPERPQHTDIVQLLWMGTRRKPQNILEKMRDLWRNGPPVTVGKQTSKAIAISQQMRAMGPGEVSRGLGPVEHHRGRTQRELPASGD